MLCGSLDGREVWGRIDTCVYIWLSPWAMHLELYPKTSLKKAFLKTGKQECELREM